MPNKRNREDRDREEVVARLQAMREELERTRDHFEVGMKQLDEIDGTLVWLMQCLERERDLTEREQEIANQAREDAR